MAEPHRPIRPKTTYDLLESQEGQTQSTDWDVGCRKADQRKSTEVSQIGRVIFFSHAKGRRTSESRMRENLTYGLMRGNWNKTRRPRGRKENSSSLLYSPHSPT